jgi:hypothetical protein
LEEAIDQNLDEKVAVRPIAAIALRPTLAGAAAGRIPGQAPRLLCGGLSAARSFYSWPGQNLQAVFHGLSETSGLMAGAASCKI